MSPLAQIKQGILQKDWTTVCDGYESLTGEKLDKWPIELKSEKVALQQIATIATSVLNEPIAEICDSQPKSAKRKPGRPVGSGKKKVTKKKATITQGWEDSSIQLDENKRTIVQKEAGDAQLITNDPDPEEVKKNKVKAERANKNKVKLDRQGAKKYRVECNECLEMFESDREGGKMGQKCPSCLREKKSRFS